MRCYSLDDNGPVPGPVAGTYDLPPAPEGQDHRDLKLLLELPAAVARAPGLSGDALLSGRELFLHGLALLVPDDGAGPDKLCPDGALLVDVPLGGVLRDASAGDRSMPVMWGPVPAPSRLLLLCLAGGTALRMATTGHLYVNRAGRLVRIDELAWSRSGNEARNRRLASGETVLLH